MTPLPEGEPLPGGNAALQATIDAGHVRLYEGDLQHVRSLLG